MTQAVEPGATAHQVAVNEGHGRLTANEREALQRAFAEDGYFVVRGVVSREKLTRLHSHLMEEFESAKRSGSLISGGGSLAGHLNCYPGEGARFAYEALEERGIIDLIKSIYTRRFNGPHVGCNFNLPNSVEQHYHTDSSFLETFFIANVAVVDTDLVNGAIDVAPGTHKKFYKYWRFVLEKPARKRLPLNQGDVLVRISTLWHRGMPNRASVARPMLAFTFGENRPEYPDPFGANDGKVVFYANWYRPTRLGRLRERSYVVAPFTYSTYRFVRSLFGSKGYATP
jgi:hypothetical protein